MADIFEKEQFLALLQAAYSESKRDWLLLAVTLLHCLRSGEAVGLTPANVIGTRLCVKRSKGSKPVDDELAESANPLLNVRRPLIELARRTPRNQRLFKMCERTFQRKVHYYGKKAKLPDKWCHPHTLKHSMIDYLRNAGMKLEELQDRSGHKSLDSLRVYLHPKKAVTDRLVSDAIGALSV